MSATLRVVDHDVADPCQTGHMSKLAVTLTNLLTSELDEARRYLGYATEEILLAALGRTIARTIGDGIIEVDIARIGVDPIPLACITAQQASASEMLAAVHCTLAAVPHVAAARPPVHHPADVFFSYAGVSDTAADETPPGLGHALELRLSRIAGLLHLEWWYDTLLIDRHTVEELAEQFPLALIELTSEADPAPVKSRQRAWRSKANRPASRRPLELRQRR